MVEPVRYGKLIVVDEGDKVSDRALDRLVAGHGDISGWLDPVAYRLQSFVGLDDDLSGRLRHIVVHDDDGVGEEPVSPLMAKRPKQVLEKCRSLVGADADRDVGSFVALRLPQHFQ
jgi:NaMN:DMB phosphoribosyltransferase